MTPDISHNPLTGRLFDAFDIARQQIVGAMLRESTWPPTYPSLGPVMFYLEDSTTGCLFNWTETTSDDLRLGGALREIGLVLRDVLAGSKRLLEKRCHALRDADSPEQRQRLHQAFEDIPEIIRGLDAILTILARDVDSVTDADAVDVACKGIRAVFLKIPAVIEAVRSLEKTDLQARGIYWMLSTIDLERTMRTVRAVTEIATARVAAYLELAERIKATCQDCVEENTRTCETCELVPYYIRMHPRHHDDLDAGTAGADVVAAWSQAVRRILNDPQCIAELQGELIYLFNFLPQEAASSRVLKQLRLRHQHQYEMRADRDNVTLADLCLVDQARYERGEVDPWPLYGVAHYFERLFYGRPHSRKEQEASIIRRAFSRAIRFFKSQVKGQVVVLFPSDVPFADCVRSIDAVSPFIEHSAKLDFYSAVISKARTAPTATLFTELLGECLPRLFNLEGMLAWERNWTTLGYRTRNPSWDRQYAVLKERRNRERKTEAGGPGDHSELRIVTRRKWNERPPACPVREEAIEGLIADIRQECDWIVVAKDLCRYAVREVDPTKEGPLASGDSQSCLVLHYAMAGLPAVPATLHDCYLAMYLPEPVTLTRLSAADMALTLLHTFVFYHAVLMYNEEKNATECEGIHQMHNHAHEPRDEMFRRMADLLRVYPPGCPEPDKAFLLARNVLADALAQFLVEFDVADKREFRKKRFSLCELVRQVVARLQVKAHDNHVDLTFMEPERDYICNSLLSAVDEMIFNLVLNAIQAFGAKPSRKDRWVRVTIHESKDGIQILVADNAGGLPGYITSTNLWRPKRKPGQTGGEGSRGLGLFQVNEFAEMIGWRVAYEKTPEGSVFSITVGEGLP